MLHLVLQAKPHDRRYRFIAVADRVDEACHLLVDVSAIFLCLGYGRPGTRAALRPFDARAKSFVIGIEIEKKILAVSSVTRLKFLEHRLKKPGRMTDVPARRRHKLSRLDHIVFDL